MLSERDGRVVLKEAFESQGYRIVEDYLLQLPEGGEPVLLDGFDPEARVGYEYLTTEDGLEAQQLEVLLGKEELVLFLIDERQVPDSQTLLQATFNFLRELEQYREPD